MLKTKKLTTKEKKILKAKNEILAAAENLFMEKEYEEVTVAEIAEKSLISRATIYNYFESKEAIFYSIGIELFQGTISRLGLSITSNQTGFEQIQTIIKVFFKGLKINELSRQILKQFVTRNNQAKIKAEEIVLAKRKKEKGLSKRFTLTQLIMADYVEQIRKYSEYWHEAIRKGQTDSSIKNMEKPERLTLMLFLVLFGVTEQMNSLRVPLERENMSVDYVLEQILIIIKGLLQ